MPGADAVDNSLGRGRLTATWVELTIRLGVLALLLYWSFVLVQPFITIAIWSAVVTVALYPVYEKLVALFGGRRRLAATDRSDRPDVDHHPVGAYPSVSMDLTLSGPRKAGIRHLR